MSHGIVLQVEQAYLKKEVPQFQVGDTVGLKLDPEACRVLAS